MVKIRLQRFGAKNSPAYRVVAVDSRKRRDSDVLESLGRYQPVASAEQFIVDEEKVVKWLKTGAKPSLTILNLLKKNGIWTKFKSAK